MSLKLNRLDGILSQKNIYLHDKLFKIYHDLKASSYTFGSGLGENNERFELVITNRSIESQAQNMSKTKIFKQQDRLMIVAPEPVENVEIFDVNGKLIINLKSLDKKAIAIRLPTNRYHVLICRIQSVSGEVFRKKVLF